MRGKVNDSRAHRVRGKANDSRAYHLPGRAGDSPAYGVRGPAGVKASEKNSSSGSPHCVVKSRCAASTITGAPHAYTW